MGAGILRGMRLAQLLTMTLEHLRAVLAALVAIAALAASGSCGSDRSSHRDTTVASRRLGESTASPGDDPDRPVARSVDTQEVSARLSRQPPAPATPPSPTPSAPVIPSGPTGPIAPGTPAVPRTPVTPGTPVTPSMPVAPTPADTGSPGVFAPPPPPPAP
jgi:hypothetical protein